MNKKNLGQYFTPPPVADFMVALSTAEKTAAVLEPSAGQGVFLQSLAKAGYQSCTGFEIDDALSNHSPFPVINKSFVTHQFGQQFALVIGNPPYIRWKNLDPVLRTELEIDPVWNQHFNRLTDYLAIFLLKSIELLEEAGELIFITQEYWMNNTHSDMLRVFMVSTGFFECIYRFGETPIFTGVASSVIIFKYRKGRPKKLPQIRVVNYSGNRKPTADDLKDLLHDRPSANKTVFYIAPFEKDKYWLLAPDEVAKELAVYEASCRKQTTGRKTKSQLALLGDLVDIGNGMVSGLDKAFQLNGASLVENEKKHLLAVAKARNLLPYKVNRLTNYLFLNNAGLASEEELQQRFPNFYTQLSTYREALQKRYNYNREIRYWEWAFLRNLSLFSKNVPKIFIPSKERISHKSHFRFALAPPGVFPTQDVTCLVPKQSTRENIYYILALLNSRPVFDWMKYKGSVKGKVVEFYEKPLHNLPFRRIDWSNEGEVNLHDEIVSHCQALTQGKGSEQQLATLVAQLF